MSSGGIPNKSRFLDAAHRYRKAMLLFIEEVLGPDRIHSELFNDQAKSRDPRKYANGMRKLEQGAPVSDLIDHADIPHLIGDNLKHFSGLNRDDVKQMHSIRKLWNDFKHDNVPDDFHSEDTEDFMACCVRVLRRCGRNEAAHEITSLSSHTPAISASAPIIAASKPAQPDDYVKPPAELVRNRYKPAVTPLSGIRHPAQHRLASNKFHDLMLREDGSVTSWGGNRYGQCNAPSGKFIAVSAGRYHSLGLREDGSVVCWGGNRYGQCNAPSGKFIAVSAGGHHSLGLREDGSVVCWGGNRYGQCNSPDGKFTAVSAGGHHSLGLCENGSIKCWGYNRFRQCGAPDGKFTAVSAGEDYSLGLREDGSVTGWGYNNDGQCNAPDGKFITISAGEYHSLGLREDSSVVHWGWQRDG